MKEIYTVTFAPLFRVENKQSWDLESWKRVNLADLLCEMLKSPYTEVREEISKTMLLHGSYHKLTQVLKNTKETFVKISMTLLISHRRYTSYSPCCAYTCRYDNNADNSSDNGKTNDGYICREWGQVQSSQLYGIRYNGVL